MADGLLDAVVGFPHYEICPLPSIPSPLPGSGASGDDLGAADVESDDNIGWFEREGIVAMTDSAIAKLNKELRAKWRR